MRAPRWTHRWYAALFGYFWAPCLICKRPFGGHEILDNTASVQVGKDHHVICPVCAGLSPEDLLVAYYRRFG
jgi:hypothetical protein